MEFDGDSSTAKKSVLVLEDCGQDSRSTTNESIIRNQDVAVFNIAPLTPIKVSSTKIREDEDEEDGFKTPKKEDQKLPLTSYTPPPAPRKPRPRPNFMFRKRLLRDLEAAACSCGGTFRYKKITVLDHVHVSREIDKFFPISQPSTLSTAVGFSSRSDHDLIGIDSSCTSTKKVRVAAD